MDLLELDFEQAKALHILFNTKLRSILFGTEIDESPVLSHYECAIGKWIYNHALQRYGHLPEVLELEQVHADIHTFARDLVAMSKAGRVEEAQEGLIRMEELGDSLISLLEQVEKKIKSEATENRRGDLSDSLSIHASELVALHRTIQDLDLRLQEQASTSAAVRRDAEISEKKFLDTVLQAPVGITILRGRNFFVEMANTKYLELVDKDEKTFVGRPLLESLPEVKSVVEPLLNQVLDTGVPYFSDELGVVLQRYGKAEQGWFNLVYQPLRNSEEAITGIIVVATEVTQQVKTKHLLAQSERQFRNLVTQSPIAMAIFKGPDFLIDIANDTLLNTLWLLKLEDVQGKKLLDVFPELVKQRFPDLLREVLRSGKSHKENEAIAIINTSHGEKKHFLDFEYAPLTEPDGQPFAVMVTINDVTEKVEARELIKDAAERLRLATEGTQLSTWDLNLQTRQIVHSPRLAVIFGFDENKTITHPEMRSYIHPDDLHSVVEKAFDKALETGLYYYESRVVHPDKTIHWIRTTGKVIFAADHTPLRMVGTLMDITHQKFLQQQQDENEERLNLVISASELGIWEIDLLTDRVSYSKRYFEIFGIFDRVNIAHDELLKRIPPENLAIRQKALDEAYHTGSIFFESAIIWDDKSVHWIEAKGKVLFNEDGKPGKLLGTIRDTTEERAARMRIEESESRLRIAALSSELGTWSFKPATQELLWDDQSKAMFDLGVDAAITLDLFWTRVHPDDRKPSLIKMRRALDPAIAETYDMEYRAIFPDPGKIRWIHAKGKAFFDSENKPYLFSGTILDITEKRIALAEVIESEEKFRLLANSMPQFIWTGDEKGILNYFNEAVYQYSGLTREQIAKDGWLQIVHPDEQEQNIAQWVNAVATGKDFIFEHRFRRHDGQYRWQLSRAVAQRNNEGKIQMWVGTSTDIHDRKIFTDELETQVQQRTLELKVTVEELRKKNNELEQFAYVASHDLQEPLRKIQTFATRILDVENNNLSLKGQDYLGRMQGASKRMQQLILDLLAFSRASSSDQHFKLVDTNLLLEKVKDQLSEQIDKTNVSIQSTVLPDLNVIVFQFEQLLTNLIANAIKFSKKDVPCKIEITSGKANGNAIHHPVADPERAYTFISVVDNGIGFDPHFSERIFQVFQRLHGKEAYEGTGIGLAICKKIAENHEGFITATGVPGKGATFTIYIPDRG